MEQDRNRSVPSGIDIVDLACSQLSGRHDVLLVQSGAVVPYCTNWYDGATVARPSGAELHVSTAGPKPQRGRSEKTNVERRNRPTHHRHRTPLERALHIDAPVETVWRLVRDPRRLTEWSPTVHQVEHHSGDVGAEGSRYVNRNRDGELEWTTHSVIIRSRPPRSLAFRVEENWAVWSFDVEVETDGTRLIQRRRTPNGISPLALELTEAFMGGQAAFAQSLLGDG